MNIDTTIHTLFEEQADRTPDAIAVTNNNRCISYRDLNYKANQFANYLLKLNVSPDTFIAICMERSLDLFIVILGILKASGAYVPLDANHPEERLLYILNDNRAPIIVVQSDLLDKFKNYRGKVIAYDTELPAINKESNNNLKLNILPEQLAYIIYTSGSTGKPKGVLIEHKSVNNYTKWFMEYSDSRPGHIMDFSTNYTFDMSISTSIVPLLIGLTITVCDDSTKKNVGIYLRHLADHKINIIKITPSYFKVLLLEIKNHFIPLPDLKVIIFGGENLSSADCAVWLNYYPMHTLFNEYGPAEATVAVTQFKITSKNIHSLDASVPIGKPGPNMECYVLDEKLQEVKDLEHGEMYIGGICLARGYLNLPDLTQKSFIPDPFNNQYGRRIYKTGDICKKLTDGSFEYIGRIDSQIKIRGFRVELAEIEKHFVAHPQIMVAVVIVREILPNEKRIVAYYVLKDASTALTGSQIRKYLSSYLPDYMIPSAFVPIDQVPITANGKLDTSNLPVPEFRSSHKNQAPTSKLEQELADIWSTELGVKNIGIHDDFFELGGHSLTAARIISQTKYIFKNDITIQDLYTHPTIAKLIPLIQKATCQTIQTVQNNISYIYESIWPLSDFQLMLWLANIFEPKAKRINMVVRKRINGNIDPELFKNSLSQVCKIHEAFTYKISRFRPMQGMLSNDFPFCETKRLDFNSFEAEHLLLASTEELRHIYPWPRNEPLIRARLFYFKDNVSEIQLVIPHIIFDENSVKILFSELSRLYLQKNEVIQPDKNYREYIGLEQEYLENNLIRDTDFWQNYLRDASLFGFPQEMIIPNMKALGIPYSTYERIEEENLVKLQQFSINHRISMHDSLCALLILGLYNCCDHKLNEQSHVFLNIVKSTRHDERFDNTIGCFLRLQPIKILLNHNITISTLAQQIHNAVIVTEPYQQCSGLLKLAFLNSGLEYSKKSNFIKMLLSAYAKLFCLSKVQQKIVSMCSLLSPVKRKNCFVINVNVQSSFIKGKKEKMPAQWCGFKTKTIPQDQTDLLNIDQFFDASFLRDPSLDTNFLVISANLKPEFKKRIAQEMLRIIQMEL